jgi:hypothetical protein
MPYMPKRNIVYFVQPDKYNLPELREKHYSDLLRGFRFDCGNTTQSFLYDFRPWTFSSDLDVRPLCLQRQMLKRIAEPSESSDMPKEDIIDIILEDQFSPCSIIKMTCGKGGSAQSINLSGFDFDNSDCVKKLQEDFPYFIYASINTWITPGCQNISYMDLNGGDPFVIYVFDTNEKMRDVERNSACKFTSRNINGQIILDSKRTSTEFFLTNISATSYSGGISPKQIRCNNVPSVINLLEHITIRDMQDEKCYHTENVDRSCHFSLLTHVSFHVIFSILIVMLTACLCVFNFEKHKRDTISSIKKQSKYI